LLRRAYADARAGWHEQAGTPEGCRRLTAYRRRWRHKTQNPKEPKMTAHKTAKIAAARATAALAAAEAASRKAAKAKAEAARAVAAAMRAAQSAIVIAEARTTKAKKNFQVISRLTA
jgi:hypothetical protein